VVVAADKSPHYSLKFRHSSLLLSGNPAT